MHLPPGGDPRRRPDGGVQPPARAPAGRRRRRRPRRPVHLLRAASGRGRGRSPSTTPTWPPPLADRRAPTVLTPAPDLARRLLAEALGTGLLVDRRRRLRDRRQPALPRRHRAPAAGELHGDGARSDRADPGVRTGLRRPPQPRRLRRRLVARPPRRHGAPGRDVAPYALAQTAGAVAGAVLANLMYDVSLAAWPPPSARAPACGSARSSRPPAWSCWSSPSCAPAGRARRTRGRRVHRGGLLVHLVHLVREPGRHRRPGLLRHVRRHRPRARSPPSCSPRSSARRRRAGARPLPRTPSRITRGARA